MLGFKLSQACFEVVLQCYTADVLELSCVQEIKCYNSLMLEREVLELSNALVSEYYNSPVLLKSSSSLVLYDDVL
jgi:hypothetical protein